VMGCCVCGFYLECLRELHVPEEENPGHRIHQVEMALTQCNCARMLRCLKAAHYVALLG
jgi:hypothetical protein